MKKADLPQLPQTPGIYQYRDENNILYIGKAKNLRKRVRSYFNGHQGTKTLRLLEDATHLTTISTRTETEALLLENQLILEHKPKYNIQLRNNRRYAWILITKQKYPRIITARNKKRRGEYFGPYTDGRARRNIITGLNKSLKLRTCRNLPQTVCLQYHIKNCAGPCEGHISKEEYDKRIQTARRVLQGHTSQVREELTQEMQQASKQQHYERAKELRDMIHSLQALEQKQVVEREAGYDQDVIAYAQEEDEAAVAVIHIRNGVIREKDEFRLEAQDELAEEFINAYYREKTPPKEIITHTLTQEQVELLEFYFTKTAGSTVTITQPQRGDKKKLLALAQENAQLTRTEHNTQLTSLKEHLNLPAVPTTIDCFDASNMQSTHIVAACIRYKNAQPEPTKYRRFQIRNKQTQDDYAAITEAVRRRYKNNDLPDLIVIDGGKGQLSAARQALSELEVHNPIISLAKDQEEVFVPGLKHSLPIPQKDPGLLLLRRIRDATHRYVIRYHRKKRSKAMTQSILDHIPGVGKQRKQQLYDEFKTFSRIKEASKKELQKLLGEKTGENVYEGLHERE